MIVHQIDIENIVLFKLKNQSPVATDPDGPEPIQISVQGMKKKPRSIHIVDCFRTVKPGQNPPEPSRELLGNSARIA